MHGPIPAVKDVRSGRDRRRGHLGTPPAGEPTPKAEPSARDSAGRGSYPREISVEVLRIEIGVIWALNLVFVVAPSNGYFDTFVSTALSFGPTSVGGPGLANFDPQNGVVFAWIIDGVTVYLTGAFILGVTTRLACYSGILFSVAFLWTQVGSTFVVPGSTDVGAYPLYILVYGVLVVDAAGRWASVDHWLWKRGRPCYPRLSRWLASPDG